MNIKIAICDDEKAEVEYLRLLVDRWTSINNNTAIISTFDSAESFLFHYEEDKSFDVLLLDIQMKNMDGVELAKEIRKENEAVQIVFITGLPDFIAEGYEVAALHYLLKPVKELKIFEVLDKACRNLNKVEKAILLNTNGESIRILASDIIFAESFGHRVMLTAAKENIELKMSISELENLSGGSLIRCHRSYIVGLKYIKRITKTDVILDNGKAVPLSRRLYDQVNKAFIKFFKGEN
jgi:DNA-binding LytR/AlgR family response regulator